MYMNPNSITDLATLYVIIWLIGVHSGGGGVWEATGHPSLLTQPPVPPCSLFYQQRRVHTQASITITCSLAFT